MNMSVVEWKHAPWLQAKEHVFKYQKLIYLASKENDMPRVRKLQHELIKSFEARLVATRKVTQDNKGKKTAGVDGRKTLTPPERLVLAKNLTLTGKSSPVKRIWIPKPGTTEKRPLGIPTIYDRALQALVLSALEPEWEAKFEPNSYGFRPCRNCHDAIKQIKLSLKSRCKYVLDADIAKCFDNINQTALLDKLGLRGKLRRQIKAWLKSGCLEGKIFTDTIQGTPQGGVISPLLANVALHGLEYKLKEFASNLKNLKFSSGKPMTTILDKKNSLTYIRYADDFVLLHADRQVIVDCREKIILPWLTKMGLVLKLSKTRLAHSLYVDCEEKKAGFNFLGFTIRHFPSVSGSSKNTKGEQLGYRLLISPSKEKCNIHQKRISEILRKHRNSPPEALIKDLTLTITGWTNYFAVSDVWVTHTLKKQDTLLFRKLTRWAKHRDGKQSESFWVYPPDLKSKAKRFWNRNKENPVFLKYHQDIKKPTITEYVKVKDTASYYDGNMLYWLKRMGNSPGTSLKIATLFRKQKSKCQFCGGIFYHDDVMEIDHIKPRRLGGTSRYENLQLLHRHCHDVKTSQESSLPKDSKFE